MICSVEHYYLPDWYDACPMCGYSRADDARRGETWIVPGMFTTISNLPDRPTTPGGTE